jgi:predicted sulfurtransferase
MKLTENLSLKQVLRLKENISDDFIPYVGTIDRFELKNLLLKNPKIKNLLSDEEFEFLSDKKSVVIGNRFKYIVTDGEFEIEIDLKNNTFKPLRAARKNIKNHFKK